MARHLPYNRALVERARDLRKNMTPAEAELWHECLRHLNVSVLRQRPIDNFIVDFYIPSLKLVIEVDGDSHFDDQGKARVTSKPEPETSAEPARALADAT